MFEDRKVYRWDRIVPIEFARWSGAVPAGTYAPDIDDRGFSVYFGPVVGVCCGDLTRISLIRLHVALDAPLFVSSADTNKVTVVAPAPDSAKIEDKYICSIDFRAGTTEGDVKLRIHAQKKDGPIISEITVHISRLLTVLCAAHRTAIYTPPATRVQANTTTRSFSEIDTLITEVNRNWRPLGIVFEIDARKDDTNLTNQVSCAGFNPTEGELLCPPYSSNLPNENYSRLMATNTVQRRLNLYFVRQIRTASPDGSPFYYGFGSAQSRGLVLADGGPGEDVEFQAHGLTHELGHIMNLAGTGHSVSRDAHADDEPRYEDQVVLRRHDIWTRRRVMYYLKGMNPADRIGPGGRYTFDANDVSYGPGRPGHMLTIKNLTNDATDNEYTDARNQQANLLTS